MPEFFTNESDHESTFPSRGTHPALDLPRRQSQQPPNPTDPRVVDLNLKLCCDPETQSIDRSVVMSMKGNSITDLIALRVKFNSLLGSDSTMKTTFAGLAPTLMVNQLHSLALQSLDEIKHDSDLPMSTINSVAPYNHLSFYDLTDTTTENTLATICSSAADFAKRLVDASQGELRSGGSAVRIQWNQGVLDLEGLQHEGRRFRLRIIDIPTTDHHLDPSLHAAIR